MIALALVMVAYAGVLLAAGLAQGENKAPKWGLLTMAHIWAVGGIVVGAGVSP